MQKNDRDGSLDFLRVLSIMGVILIHSIALIVLQSPINSTHWMIGNIIDSSIRWCVPVFVMISGSLSIRPATFSHRADFLKKRLGRIVSAIAIWPIIYIAWDWLITGSKTDISTYAKTMVAGNPAPGHLYFLFLILGLYALTPIISLYAKHASEVEFRRTTFLILLATGIWHLTSSFMPNLYGAQTLSFLTYGLPYVGIYMTGYSLKDFRTAKPYGFALLYASAVAFTVIASASLSSSKGLGQGLAFYHFASIPATVMSLSFFIFAREIYFRISSNKIILQSKSYMSVLSNATYGVYLIHMIILTATIHYFHLNQLSLKHVALLCVITTIGSYVISIGMSRIRYVRSII